jgi:eukaryotic-like serine/threonine-protein kinase
MPKAPAKGDLIGEKYLVESVVGRGGYGTVYRAKHIRLDEDVAIKVLHTSLVSDPNVIERFLQEARAAAKIRHAGSIQVRDVDQAKDGTLFIVMEFLEGESLSTRLTREKRLDLTTSLLITRSVCETVAAAHRMGVVHRDIKPANIFLAQHGDTVTTKLLDFGISKLARNDRRLTSDYDILGSPRYMAPEQLTSPIEVGPAADVFAIGLLFYRCITGEYPWRGESLVEACRAVVEDAPIPIRDRVADLPDDLVAIIMRCLSRYPADRCRDAGELLLALGGSRESQTAIPSATPSSALIAPAPSNAAPPSTLTASVPDLVPEFPSSLGTATTRIRSSRPNPNTSPGAKPWVYGLIAIAVVASAVGATLIRRDAPTYGRAQLGLAQRAVGNDGIRIEPVAQEPTERPVGLIAKDSTPPVSSASLSPTTAGPISAPPKQSAHGRSDPFNGQQKLQKEP